MLACAVPGRQHGRAGAAAEHRAGQPVCAGAAWAACSHSMQTAADQPQAPTKLLEAALQMQAIVCKQPWSSTSCILRMCQGRMLKRGQSGPEASDTGSFRSAPASEQYA